MPIYEYECRECGHKLDALQKISDEPLIDCPSCKEASLKRLISAPQFRLKGGGWYETDFKTGDKKNLAEKKEAPKKSDSSSGKDKKSGGNKDAGGSAAA